MKTLKVLAVDDEREFIQALAERLEMRDIRTELAFTGEEALRRIREEKFDVILLDMVLERSRGLDVLKAIRKIRPDQAVILLSGRGTEQDMRDGRREGAFDYLIKPIRLEALMEKIRQAAKIEEDS